MKIWQLIFLSYFVIGACSKTKRNESSSQPERKYLAKNVILAGPSLALADDIDTVTKVSAANVVFEIGNSGVRSNNVQGAIDEIAIPFAKNMIGTWEITNRGSDSTYSRTGVVEISSNGTFTLKSGDFAAIGLNSGCNSAGEKGYEIFGDNAVLFKTYADFEVLPTVISQNKDKIVLTGYGGCGAVGQQRLSILTRIN